MPSNNTPHKRSRLDLPFVRRRRDIVSRIYHHRAGIFAVATLALVMAILFIGSKIVVRTPEPDNAFLVDLRTVEELRQEARRLQREVDLRRELTDGSPVSNAISNEGAELGDDPRTPSARERAGQVQGHMDARREAWEQGLREIDAIGVDDGNWGGGRNNGSGSDGRVKGRVLVSFSLVSPLRSGDGLVTPGYRCERSGEVVVNIIVGRGGDVVSAEVDRSISDKDACMHSTALDAARRSHFNIDSSAPERHTGTITYTFVAQ